MQKPDTADKRHFFSLMERYQDGTATAEEARFVEQYLRMLEHRAPVPENFESNRYDIGKEIENQLLDAIAREKAPPATNRVRSLRRYWWAAASAAVILSAGSYLLLRQPPEKLLVMAPPADVLPGKNGAVLTLSNGRQVLLDSLGNGQIAVQQGATLTMQNGSLAYGSDAADGEAGYNTISTPKGRQFRVVLPDGSVVWLNAASSITYFTRFDGPERRVKVNGEAYFEIAPKAGQPFRVSLNERTEVVVLGTRFNINAYHDESAIYTTLLSGAVKVMNAGSSKVLQPGQQAGIQAGSRDIDVAKVNAEEAVAWKNGSFTFHNADIRTVMRQLARWYDIEVKYEGEVPQGTFSGEIDRSLTLTQVLKGLAATRIHYRLEHGNILVIQP